MLEAVRGCGLDSVFLGSEHIALGRGELRWMCRTYAALGMPPLVRMPSPDPHAATVAVDGTATGLAAPHIEPPEQVEAPRGAVKLRPVKGRKLQQMLAGDEVEPGLASNVYQSGEDGLPIAQHLWRARSPPTNDSRRCSVAP